MNRIRLTSAVLGFVTLLALAPLAWADAAPARLEPGDLVAIGGDSITEMIIYSVYIEDYLLMCQPVPAVKARQFGFSGEQASGFLARLDNDLLPFKPNVVTTFYGMNDGAYAAITDAVRDRYYTKQKGVVEALKKGGVRWVVVGSPGCVDLDTYNKKDKSQAVIYNQTLATLRDVARKVAAEEGVTFVDVHDVLMDAMKKAKAKFGPDYSICGYDGIHPWANGHLVIAYAFLKALGCDGNIGTINVDLGAGTAEASTGHKIVSAHDGTVEVESTRYPFCFSGDAVAADGTQLNTRKILSCVPFNQDLNRFRLVVKTGDASATSGASGGHFRVEWLTPALAQPGAVVPPTAAKVFTAEQLAKGINLAEEFLDNPFYAPFMQVHHLADAQQHAEQSTVRGLIETLGAIPEPTPAEIKARQVLIEGQVRRLKPPLDAAAAAVQPVRHVIRIRRVDETGAAAAPASK